MGSSIRSFFETSHVYSNYNLQIQISLATGNLYLADKVTFINTKKKKKKPKLQSEITCVFIVQ